MSYLLDNVSPDTGERFAGLEACFDQTTFRHLTALGIAPGWRCWELGAGGGSVACWMAEQVGDRGTVLATDLNTDWMAPDMPSTIEIRQHDVDSDPIPTSTFELIHARLVLAHLPRRDAIIPRLVSALAPGGWLVLEEFSDAFPIYPEPATDEERAFIRVVGSFRELLHRRGADTTSYPQTLAWRLERSGLVGVGAEGRLIFGRGRTPAAAVFRANLRQTGHLAVDAGLASKADVTTFLRLLDDPQFIFTLPILISAWGQHDRRRTFPVCDQGIAAT
jgi:SAM-dependent methyltransferase